MGHLARNRHSLIDPAESSHHGLELLRGFFIFFSARQIDRVATYHIRPLRRRICLEGYASWRSLPIRHSARWIRNLPLLKFDGEFCLFYQPLHDGLSAINLRDHGIDLLAVIGDATVSGVVAVPTDLGVNDVELRQIDGGDTAGHAIDQQPSSALPLPVWWRNRFLR